MDRRSEKRLGCPFWETFSCDVCEPEKLPLRFFPRPSEKDRRERRESMEMRESSPAKLLLFILTGGYFRLLLFLSAAAAAASAPFLRLPNSEPLRNILPPNSPIVLDRLWPLPSLPSSPAKPETLANFAGTALILGRPISGWKSPDCL